MSLRSKVFLLFGALLAILMGSQWFMMRSITQDASRELGQVAFSVARDTASFFILGQYQWNEQILFNSILNSSAITTNSRESLTDSTERESVKLKTITDIESTGSSTNNKGERREIRAQQVFVYTPPAVEIRLGNQIKDNFLEVITSTGTQNIPIPREGMIKTVKGLENKMMTGSLIILVIGLIIAAYFSHRLTAPLRKLSDAAESVASGELGTTINNEGRFFSSEIKTTVESFNHMSNQLAEVEQLKSKIRENEHYKELGEIARGLAHSIRNPLNTLGLSVEELARNDLELEKRSKLVVAARRQIQRVDQWIRSFMTFSLSGSTEQTKVKITPLIQDIRLEANQLVKRKIKFNVACDKTLEITGVEAEIKAILHALIINAVEASPDEATVSIEVSKDDGAILTRIIDEGSGIPADLRENLFKPHQTTKAKGSGMGLYMAHRLATNRYNGDIKIEDREPTGTVVELKLSEQRVA